jgi:hypothetical protein
MANKYKIVVFVPEAYADTIRDVIGKAGAGRIGNYSSCSFSSKGVGRFLPKEGANPAIGEIGKIESVEEERIESVVSADILKDVISAIKKAHPYEEVALDVYPLEDL